MDFLRHAVIMEDWARQLLGKIDSRTTFRDLQQNLASILQIEGESRIRSSTKRNQDNDSIHPQGSKPQIFFTSPKYAKRIAKKIFPGQELNRSCWNCGSSDHRFPKCPKKLNPVNIAARKANWLAGKEGIQGFADNTV